jgi:hypothetical protein
MIAFGLLPRYSAAEFFNEAPRHQNLNFSPMTALP